MPRGGGAVRDDAMRCVECGRKLPVNFAPGVRTMQTRCARCLRKAGKLLPAGGDPLEIRGQGFAVPPLPERSRIEISTVCNARCLCCNIPLPHRLMEWNIFEQALGFVRPDARCDLYGVGEPTLHPRLRDMVGAVCGRGGKPHISTNGILLDGEMLDTLCSAGLDLVTFSLFASDEQLHERLQGVPSSRAVWENFRRVCERGLKPAVTVVMMAPNLPELPAIVERVADYGGRWLTLLEVCVWPGSPAEQWALTRSENVEPARTLR